MEGEIGGKLSDMFVLWCGLPPLNILVQNNTPELQDKATFPVTNILHLPKISVTLI
jgi:hypothetical protein